MRQKRLHSDCRITPEPKETGMPRSRSIVTFLAGAVVVPITALALAACGGGSGHDTSATTTRPMTRDGQSATVGVSDTGLGNVLVDSHGRTLYLFRKDSGTTSECTGPCANFWPPLKATASPTVGTGAKASLIGTTRRSDGTSQITYNGHPVYTYTGDHQAGDTTGQGLTAFGAGWFALSANGDQVSGHASSSGSGSGNGGGGNGY
jgi:predicted lipoprotein with Yx(FWY)xxD motif